MGAAKGSIRDQIIQQQLAAQKAGPRNDTVLALSQSQLDQPLTDMIAPAELAIGNPSILGYEFVREISRGGQASVFLAVQQSTGRSVAIKVMAGGPYITSANRARFEREVQVLARLNHPNIVGILDRGRTADGSFFIVMDYVDGVTLDAHLAQRRREGATVSDVLALFQKVAGALDEAHRHGIIHRDIKPSNVRVDARGEPHILDFGLAHLNDPDESMAGRVTVVGNVVGSLPWASPEQARGDAAKLGAPSDVYSLGVVLYHALTGIAPYRTTGLPARDAATIANARPRTPSSISNAPFGEIDPGTSRIVCKALAKDSAARYATAGALASDLKERLAGRRTIVARETTQRRWRWCVGLTAAAVMGSIMVWRLLPARKPPVPFFVIDLPHFDNAVGMRMVRLNSGSFWMGSPESERGRQDNEELHLVSLSKGFYISATEVTRKQYRQVMGTLPSGLPEGSDDLPVDRISRDDAVEFCKRLSALDGRAYRLPTEAEWEYACRAGTQTPFAGTGTLSDVGWYAGNSGGHPHQAATRSPNHWGLYDMHGNVAEWCDDAYTHWLGTDPQTDPVRVRNSRAHLTRGGKFDSKEADCTSARRLAQFPITADAGLGFRPVAALAPATRPANGG